MKPQDMFAKVPQAPVTSRELALWPQAAGELAAFANWLEGQDTHITADQVRLAIRLAQEAYEDRQKLRPVEVHGAKGWFHRWGATDTPANALGDKLGVSCAVVEFEDGSVAAVPPAEVQFLDREAS